MIEQIKKHRYLAIGILILFATKLAINSLLVAENPDTYDFFKVAYFLRSLDFTVESKRMFLLPLLISYFPVNWYVWVGRIWINLFYFASIYIFYYYFKLVIKLKSDKVEKSKNNYLQLTTSNLLPLLATLIFATNIVIFENSFYILADTIFLFFNLLYLYIYKKFGLNKWLLLTVIAGLAFYTRPEGLVLFAVTGTLILVNLNKDKILNPRSYIKILSFVITSTVIIAPYLIRNYLVFNSISNAGYFSDDAGFIFDTKTILMRVSNFTFGLGGVWLVPLIVLMLNKIKINLQSLNNNKVEIAMFTLYSAILFIWGPYIRLFSIPITLIIVFVFLKIKNLKTAKVSKIKITATTVLLVLMSLFYILVVQKYDHSDLGYKKWGKFIALGISVIIIIIPIIKNRINLKYNSMVVLITTFILVINLGIFIDKYNITRYKNASIYYATQLYISEYKDKGKLGYDSNTDLEQWYLKDFNEDYDFLKTWKQLNEWSNSENINYIITTQEGGSNDKFIDFGKLSKINHRVVKEYESPFFYGTTRLIEFTD